MIHYQLVCSSDHSFDGWFRDSAGFERQCEAGFVVCPECGDTKVRRALMAPSIKKTERIVNQAGVDQAGVDQVGEPQAASPAKAGAVLPDQVRAMLQRLRVEVEKNCEDVGDRFAEEARAIHHGEAEARGIYGESTPEQAEALAEEGIEVARIPWVPRADG